MRPAAPVVATHAEAARLPVGPASLETPIDAGGGGSEWPLRLVTFTPAAVNLGGSPNQPILFELLGQPDGAPWQVWGELNPATAREFGVRHGATIRIASVSGSIDAMAMIVERTPPGIVAVAFVPALGSGGRWARLVSADVRRLCGRDARMESVAVRVTAV